MEAAGARGELTRKAIELRQTIPALWQGDQENYYIYTGDLNEGILAMKRWGVEDPGDEALIVMNFSDNTYTDKVFFPPGLGETAREHSRRKTDMPKDNITKWVHEEPAKWVEVFNSDAAGFNAGNEPDHERGWNRVNGEKAYGGYGMNLAPWSVAVFRRKR